MLQLQRTARPLLPKPDWPDSLRAKTDNDAGWSCRSVVHGCPQGTGDDRCEWQVSGTAGELTRHTMVSLAPGLTAG
jgi:hypothetical protein